MRLFSVLGCLLFLAAPAYADWEYKGGEDDYGPYALVTQTDKAGITELQFICDGTSRGHISLMLYSDVPFAEVDYPDSFPLTLTIDGRIEREVTAQVQDFETEALIVSGSFDGPVLKGNLLTVLKAKSQIAITYADKSFKYAAAGIGPAIGELGTSCSSLGTEQ